MKNLIAIKFIIAAIMLLSLGSHAQKKNHDKEIQLVTSDIDRFWEIWDNSKRNLDSVSLKASYLMKGTDGLMGFIPNRIGSATNLVYTIKKNKDYYAQLRESTDQLPTKKESIINSLRKFQKIYPEAKIPPVYFVIGALNSGGTSFKDGLIIGVDMYGKTPNTNINNLSSWLQEVLKPIDEIPHIVAHELMHFQQNYFIDTLLGAAIKEGSADFVAELISGKHINHHVHDFANPIEEELWNEFKERMHVNDFKGWLYSSTEGRPNDLGYWMGYKITEAYYNNQTDKHQALYDIFNIKDVKAFLDKSRYAEKFD